MAKKSQWSDKQLKERLNIKLEDIKINATDEKGLGSLVPDKQNLKELGVKGGTKAREKERLIREYRKEASRMVSQANKRLARLEKNKLQDSPAYQTYIEGKGKFSVKGKSYNQVQAEVSRLKGFLQAKTSTIRGTNQVLKQMAKNTGIKYKNLTDLKAKSAKFFELANKTEQYLRTVKDNASAIGYQKIWNAINKYIKQENIDLANTTRSIDDMIEDVNKAIEEYKKPAVLEVTWYKP